MVITTSAYLRLPLDHTAPAAARHGAKPVLIGWGCTDETWLGDAAVVISELVSNAVIHADGCVELSLELRGGRVVWIGVADTSSTVPVRRVATVDGGHGLAIVEDLTARLHVQRYHRGKRVWAVLRPCPLGI
ncbi:anti-sigma regulatory factor (Ser/Thr protein kinase) [Hamadaea flava]|uniref:ATP-binding protein n=1 Tax=Hamadaea flava TaxID=1742688 RepID=A0ABV8LXT7_9ACTN|nr:ATP-binding protein [Hamadaea flava]MCP2329152.1 anti-sigma regulatory factor (Ser/Thr protein kinase) [Hamadaea flava]